MPAAFYICPLCRQSFSETNNPKAEKLASTEAGKLLKVSCPHCGRPISLYEALQSAKTAQAHDSGAGMSETREKP